MRGKTILAGLLLSLAATAVSAQNPANVVRPIDLYCNGTITNEDVPKDTYVITGEGSNYKITFTEGDYVYLNKGAGQGVKVGDQFSVIRSVVDPNEEELLQVAEHHHPPHGHMVVNEGRVTGKWWRTPTMPSPKSLVVLQLRAARRHPSALQGAARASPEVRGQV